MAIKRLYGESDDTYNKRSSMTGYTYEYKAMLNCMDELQKIWDKALVSTVKNYKSNRAIKKSTSENGGVKYDLRYTQANINENIASLLKKVSSGEFKANEKVYFDNVSEKTADKIEQLTGINVTGFKVAIEARQLEHILKDHGINGKSDHSMKNNEDIAKMEYVLNFYDDISLSGKTQAYSYMKNGRNVTANTVLYEKTIGDNSYYVVQAIADTKAKTLYIVTAFIGEKGYKKKASQLINAKGPNATSKDGSAIASNNRLSQKRPIVNTQYMQNSDNDTEKFSVFL